MPRCPSRFAHHSWSEWAPKPSPPLPMVVAGIPRAMGTFEVGRTHAEFRLGADTARVAASARWMSGASTATLPEGRSPIKFDIDRQLLALPAHGVLFGEGFGHCLLEDRVNLLETAGLHRAHVHFHPVLEGDGVDRGAAADPPDVVGGLRACGHIFAGAVIEQLDRPRHRVSGVAEPEGAPRMAPRAEETDPVPVRTDRVVHARGCCSCRQWRRRR